MKKFLLSMAIVAIAGAGTQVSAQTAPANAINGKFSVAQASLFLARQLAVHPIDRHMGVCRTSIRYDWD